MEAGNRDGVMVTLGPTRSNEKGRKVFYPMFSLIPAMILSAGVVTVVAGNWISGLGFG